MLRGDVCLLEPSDGLVSQLQLIRVGLDHLPHRHGEPIILNLKAVDLLPAFNELVAQVLYTRIYFLGGDDRSLLLRTRVNAS